MRAYCYPSGLIDFGDKIPAGATVIARGPEKALRDFIAAKARRVVGGRRAGVPGTGNLLVPGIPKADSALAATQALDTWAKWIAIGAPRGVRVLPR